ncbi:MAG: Cystathione beta-synthase modulated DegT/DnrJ/EryC1/StrS aminotransferase [Microgenomates group bacterium GW2011_GWC2_46_7]|nr:MAG: Cystathione beta-synthase modulated DegT/DnrJ/EryC1/StrS aminotransferase [Microgenomates group bacterium GW2011_GWC2_46_7]
MIPVNAPVITAESKQLVGRALDEGWISSAGPYVEQFEREFAQYLGVKHSILVNTGTAALHVALLASGIGAGDEVIVPAFTMASSYLAVMYTGATPVFVDVEPDIFTIDPKLIESAITPKTKAIMPVHIYGHPADLDPIMAIAKKHHLVVIEDAAEAHGATYRGVKVGSLGDINAFSFYANKIVTTGEGGMVTTNDDHLAELSRRHGVYNYRATSLQAALGIGSLHAITDSLRQKTHMAELYEQGLSGIPGLTLPTTRGWATNVYWMYAILLDPTLFGMSKDELRAQLLGRGVDTRDFFYAPADQPILHSKKHFPITEDIATNGLYLPSGLSLTDQQINAVCRTISQIAAAKPL